MTVTAETPWRELGDTTIAGLIAEFRTVKDSPLVEEAARLLAAARGHSRLLAAMSWVEQKHSTWESVAQPKGANSHNFLSISAGWADGSHIWRSFTSYAACASRWVDRLLAADGPYAGTVTLRDLVEVYAPKDDGNDVDRYVEHLVTIVNRMHKATTGSITVPAAPRPPRLPMPLSHAPIEIRFGQVVAPPVEWRDIDGQVNTAWDNLGQRVPRFVVIHRMLGSLDGTDRYFRNEARQKARTDYGIDHRTGVVWRWTDPLGRMAPWASGPYDDPTALGRALVTRFGLATVNRDGVSIEVSGGERDPVSEAALEAVARLVAFWADYAGIPHTSWPINPATGVSFLARHSDFAVKACPFVALDEHMGEIAWRTGVILRDAQTGGLIPAPVQPTRPPVVETPVTAVPPTGLVLPVGVSIHHLGDWFGQITSNGEKALTFSFDPKGPVTQLWLARGREDGVWPQLAAVTVDGAVRFFRVEDGWTVRAAPDGVGEVAA